MMAGHHSDQTSKTVGVQLLAMPHHWLFVDVHATLFDLFCGSCAEVLAFWRFVIVINALSGSPMLEVASLNRKHPQKAAFQHFKHCVVSLVKSFSERNEWACHAQPPSTQLGTKQLPVLVLPWGFSRSMSQVANLGKRRHCKVPCCIICLVLQAGSNLHHHPHPTSTSWIRDWVLNGHLPHDLQPSDLIALPFLLPITCIFSP